MTADNKNTVWNSAAPLFDSEGNEPQKFEISEPPRRTTGSISKPMAPKEEIKGDALT